MSFFSNRFFTILLVGAFSVSFSACDAVNNVVNTAKAATQTAADLDRNLRKPLTKKRLQHFLLLTPKLMNDAKAEGIRIPMPSTSNDKALFDATDFDHLGKIVPFFKRHQGDFAEWLAVLLKSQDALSQLANPNNKTLNEKNDWALQQEELALVQSMQQKVEQALKKVP